MVEARGNNVYAPSFFIQFQFKRLTLLHTLNPSLE